MSEKIRIFYPLFVKRHIFLGLPSSTEVGAVFLSFFVELIIIGFAKVMQKVNGNIAFSSTKPTTNTLKKSGKIDR